MGSAVNLPTPPPASHGWLLHSGYYKYTGGNAAEKATIMTDIEMTTFASHSSRSFLKGTVSPDYNYMKVVLL